MTDPPPPLDAPLDRHLRDPLAPKAEERMLKAFKIRQRSTLTAPVEAHLRPALEGDAPDRMLRSFKVRREAQASPPGWRRWGGLAAPAVALAAVVLFAVWMPAPAPAPEALTLEDGAALPEVIGEDSITLTDGSRIALDGEDAAARVVENDGTRFATRLTAGRARFEVTPGGPRRWVVEAGATRVEVVGTVFVVDRSRPGIVRVEVSRGRVEVFHPSLAEPARLTPGRALELPDAETAAPVERPVEAARPTVPVDEAPAPPEAEAPPSPEPLTTPGSRPTPGPTWRVLAQHGDFRAAWTRLGADGVRRAAVGADPADLLVLADIARNAGDPREAVPLLRRVADGGSAESGAAAFILGRLQLERLGAPLEAAATFASVPRRAGSGPLRADALALEAEAWRRAGREAAARAAATAYLETHPEGARAAAMRRLLGGE
jgi:transmembrane sensor